MSRPWCHVISQLVARRKSIRWWRCGKNEKTNRTMNLAQTIISRLRAMIGKRKLDAEMDEEMRSHVEMRTQENVAAGMPPDAARAAALQEFGWTESIKETCREQRRL